jgi:hypothetical protein
MAAITLSRTNWPNLGGLFALVVCSAEIAGVWRSLDPLLGVWSQEEYSHAWFILLLWSLIFIQRPSYSQSIIAMSLATGGSAEANRVVIEKRGVRQIVYYWFEERGRHLAKEGALKYYTLRDALVDNRTDGALIRIVIPTYGGNEAAADALATKFAKDATALLQSFVPGRISQQCC